MVSSTRNDILMRCDCDKEEGKAVIRVCPRFTFESHREFRRAYEAALDMKPGKLIQLDMSKVEYLDSSALGMILLLKDKADAQGMSVEFRGIRGLALKIFETARFDKLFRLN